jgi:hypothetical protein
MKNKRSIGITVFSLIYIVIGLSILTFLLTAPRETKITYGIHKEAYAPLPLREHIIRNLQIALILVVPNLIVGIGIFKLQKWARMLLVILNALSLLIFVPLEVLVIIVRIISRQVMPQAMGGHNLNFLGGFISILFIIFPLFSLIFFTRPNIKEQFN